MKKHLLIISSLFLSVAASAQWISQATGFSTVNLGIRNICAVDANVVWVSTYDGAAGTAASRDFSRTTNGGATWTPGTVAAPSTYAFINLWAIDANTAWAALYNTAGAGSGIYKTTTGGGTWNQSGSGTIFNTSTSFINTVYFSDANNGFALGDPAGGYFEIYTTTNGGTTWTRTPQANIPAILSSEYGTNKGWDVIGTTIWFTTTRGRVFKSTDLGLNWTVATGGISSGTASADIAMRTTTEGLMSLNGTLKKTTDGGATWTSVTISSGTLHTADLETIPNGTAYVSTGAGVGNYGSSYSLDAGANWITIDAGGTSIEQHTAQGWVNGTTGWCGGFNTSATADGVFKFDGTSLGITALNNDYTRMRMFPNPSNGQFTLQIAGAETQNAVVKIVDVVGNVVFESFVPNNSTLIEKQVNMSTAAKGVYFVTVENGINRFVNKIVIE